VDVGEARAGLNVVTTRRPSGVLEVLAEGELDLATTPDLVGTVASQLAAAPSDVVLVLEGVTFIDSTGTIALLEVERAVLDAGHGLRLSSPSEAVSQVLVLTGLLDRFEVE
jgi:anti-sigma B factor antagonist